MGKIKPILRYPGAKWRIGDWIIRHIPCHDIYLEPYFGSGAVFFNKQPSKNETINDINNSVVNLFRIIRDRPDEIARLIALTPWARSEYNASSQKFGSDIEDARRFMVRCWQAHGSCLSSKTGWRSRIQAKGGNYCDTWLKVPDRILTIVQRLKECQIENMNAVDLIRRYRLPNVLIYADPPYVLSTRSGKMYANEMSEADHVELLDALEQHPGQVLLSGYSSTLYDCRLRHWTRKSIHTRAEKGKLRQEVLWLNPVASEQLGCTKI